MRVLVSRPREFASAALRRQEGPRECTNRETDSGIGGAGLDPDDRRRISGNRDDIRKIVPDADFDGNPQDLRNWALLSAVSYWTRADMGELADQDDIVGVTAQWNGTNGLDDRKRYRSGQRNLGRERLDKSRPVLRVRDNEIG